MTDTDDRPAAGRRADNAPDGLDLSGRPVLVAGLARSGMAAVRFLASRGALVTVADLRTEDELGDRAAEARRLGASLELGEHAESVFTSPDLIVASPGVPLSLPVIEAARRHGIPVLAEVELAARFLRGRIAGITGSNGKSTTTSLAGAMLAAAGLPARTCGNIGTPLIDLVDQDTPGSVYAVELSSFQLEGIIALRAEAAVVVNLSPDHLDRYASYGAYIAAKARIFANQQPGDVAVLNASDADSNLMLDAVRAPIRYFSSAGTVDEGAGIEGGRIVFRTGGTSEALMPVAEVPIPGRHNLDNVLAAALAARHLGASVDAIRTAVADYRALPHRLEHVALHEGVDYYNDSKATNVGSCLCALRSFPGRGVHIILGGRDKGGDFSQLRDALERGAVAAYLIGEASGAIERQISGAVTVHRAGDLATAVASARAAAEGGDVVLLAPGCASFDQFRDYEDRGERFRSLVLAMTRRDGEA